ncbi:MAG: cupin fold metalloprotein, WbuC family [Elusimicrobia bacterium]|nr:cupin fold metalloprotein, WbuC family [Elusimicrobiota bacterium]
MVPIVDLDDPKTVLFDGAGRSAAFFCKGGSLAVGNRLLGQLREYARARGGANVRLCLHEGPRASFHEMIILEHRGRYRRPHKHPSKHESLHLVEGELGVFVFGEDGGLACGERLDGRGSFLFWIEPDAYHSVVPLSEVVIYHECKPGPFLRDSDNVSAPWAPDGSDPEAAQAYLENLRTALP